MINLAAAGAIDERRVSRQTVGAIKRVGADLILSAHRT
jgi:Delta-aminolevulinic acid dehydratase